VKSALQIALRESPVLVITDLNLPDRNGMELIRDLQERGVDATLVVLTGHGTIESAVEATRSGVYDYLVKPVDGDRLRDVARKGLERAALRREIQLLRRERLQEGRLQELIGRSTPMLELYRMIEQVAPTDASILITGESGTGKELVARAVHRLSDRGSSRLVTINCAAIPESLLESEVFGHEKGAFTGATGTRAGCFELADGGTLFLDEIGEMPADLQSKLLRVLEDGVVRRVGGEKERQVDVRVLAATNIDLEEQLDDGRFREDLYYRLNVIRLSLPPLRARGDDIDLLADHFLAQFAETSGKSIVGFSDAALARLRTHAWPGNARELRNVVERAVILCSEGEIGPQHLPATLKGARPGAVPRVENGDEAAVRIPVGTTIREAEKALILATLDDCEDNRTRTASVLGITPKTLYSKLRRYEEEDGEDAS
jgi:DNA-binding NtrC family response regulator